MKEVLASEILTPDMMFKNLLLSFLCDLTKVAGSSRNKRPFINLFANDISDSYALSNPIS